MEASAINSLQCATQGMLIQEKRERTARFLKEEEAEEIEEAVAKEIQTIKASIAAVPDPINNLVNVAAKDTQEVEVEANEKTINLSDLNGNLQMHAKVSSGAEIS